MPIKLGCNLGTITLRVQKRVQKVGQILGCKKYCMEKKTYLNLASNPFCKKSFFKWRITIEAEEKKSWNESR